MTRPSWLGRAVRNRHRHAIEQATRRWRGGRRDDSARTRRKILIPTQVGTLRPRPVRGVRHARERRAARGGVPRVPGDGPIDDACLYIGKVSKLERRKKEERGRGESSLLVV